MENLKKRLKNRRNNGFTLVELLVVIAIIAVLSVTAYVALGGQTGKARNSRRMQDVGAIQNALEVYFVENFSKYPSQLDDGNPADSSDDLVPKYMPNLPTDPIPGNTYEYSADAAANFKTYKLSATLEEEDGTYKAYVIGNSDNNSLITGFSDIACTVAGCNVLDGGTCVAYCP